MGQARVGYRTTWRARRKKGEEEKSGASIPLSEMSQWIQAAGFQNVRVVTCNPKAIQWVYLKRALQERGMKCVASKESTVISDWADLVLVDPGCNLFINRRIRQPVRVNQVTLSGEFEDR